MAATRSAASLPFGALAPLLPPPNPEALGAVEGQGECLRRCCNELTDRFGATVSSSAWMTPPARPRLRHPSSTIWPGPASISSWSRCGSGNHPPTRWWRCGRTVWPNASDLAGVSSAAIEELLGAVLGGRIDLAALARLSLRSHGNMLYLRELVVGAMDTGALVDDGGL